MVTESSQAWLRLSMNIIASLPQSKTKKRIKLYSWREFNKKLPNYSAALIQVGAEQNKEI